MMDNCLYSAFTPQRTTLSCFCRCVWVVTLVKLEREEVTNNDDYSIGPGLCWGGGNKL